MNNILHIIYYIFSIIYVLYSIYYVLFVIYDILLILYIQYQKWTTCSFGNKLLGEEITGFSEDFLPPLITKALWFT